LVWFENIKFPNVKVIHGKDARKQINFIMQHPLPAGWLSIQPSFLANIVELM